MSEQPIRVETDARGVATITIDRPQVANAFDEATIEALHQAVLAAGKDDAVRVVVLTGAGKAFCAGADLGWMKRAAALQGNENLQDAMRLAELLYAIHTCPKPTLALVNGAAYGGGVGVVAACDIAIAATPAKFRLSEVRLGILPAVISPYLVAAMGSHAAKRLSVTAALFDAEEAFRLGLVAERVAPEELSAAGERVILQLLENGPAAMAATKRLIEAVTGQPIGEAVLRDTANRIATTRVSAEGREGIAAFLEKRKPSWIQ